jgi:hypothetical protein
MSIETATIHSDAGHTITADVGYNEGALGMIARGYDHATRCLHFRVRFVRGEGASAACLLIRDYNAFDGEAVAERLEGLLATIPPDEIGDIYVGREKSVVVYVEVRRRRSAEVMLAMREVEAAEVTFYNGEVRAWWD